MVRIIYEDGTVGMVSSEPLEVSRDDLEPDTPVDTDAVCDMLDRQFKMVRSRIWREGTIALYEEVKQEAASRRQEALEVASAAHRKRQGRKPG
jgi:hypothetical protein